MVVVVVEVDGLVLSDSVESYLLELYILVYMCEVIMDGDPKYENGIFRCWNVFRRKVLISMF